MAVANRLRLDVPSQLSVAGFDDTPGAKITWPQLTTVRQPIHAMAGAAADMLMQGVEREEGAPPPSRLLDFELVVRAGWPAIVCDGKLLVSHQDALLIGGKVQAAPGYADHVTFEDHDVCRACCEKTCIEACSGQAITTNPDDGVPLFDREKCLHCGACLWNCSKPSKTDPERTNVRFTAGAGGLHSAEN